jgi:molybdopterin/thiamine biosynthesis adenylyltransferase
MSGFDSERYSRQTRFAGVGADGQRKLAAASVAVVGCGALGGAVAVTLARAGVGTLRLVDRDVPELSNLPRQVLFDEADVAAGLPKAVAAARHLARINSAGRYEPVVVDLAAANVAEVLGGVDLIVDGSDNFEARFLVNEFACRQGVPWVYGGAIGAEGRVLAIIPGRAAGPGSPADLRHRRDHRPRRAGGGGSGGGAGDAADRRRPRRQPAARLRPVVRRLADGRPHGAGGRGLPDLSGR